ncbi:hypothetical protein FEM48_Zijuj10G0096600 [Ziziphus jujuba var. spinosa]|uniref:X8 domain-containing protein n=1 Tax=Ziziphus jujuba var. spinosa TaxID=714518 RepID=A0A978UMM7_ZIZJJ|nr:hypothetical protein FEM48_Zijuj10G0096600 [Ziziphus jujuba var. spinosa]
MAALAYIVFLLALAGRSSATYCVCKDGGTDQTLQKALDYACGAGADCSPILQNGVCYNPNTVKAHCDYAVNSYFQKKNQATGSCDFSGIATQTNTAPSGQTTTCVYPAGPSQAGGSTNTTTPPTTPSTTPTTPSTTPTTTPSTTPTTTPSTGTGTGTTTTTSPTTFGISPAGTTSINDSSAEAIQGNKLLFSLFLMFFWFSSFLMWG